MTTWILAATTALAIAIAWAVHTRRCGWLPEDEPNAMRKRHAGPTPLIGVVPATIAIVWCAVHGSWFLAAGAAAAALTGWLDDRTKSDADGIDWKAKAVGLLVAAAFGTAHIGAGTELGWLWLTGAFLSVFCLTNAVNFLDNANGVAVSLGGLALVWVGGIGVELAGVFLAVLPFNWPRGRLFLGDTGALSLGLLVSTLAIADGSGAGGVDVVASLAPIAIFALDFVQVVAARLWLGYAPWIADRRHLTHIAGSVGVPHDARAPLLAALAFFVYAGITTR